MSPILRAQSIMLGKVMLGLADPANVDPAKFDAQLNFVAQAIDTLARDKKRYSVNDVYHKMMEDGTIAYAGGVEVLLSCVLAAMV